MWSLTGNWTRDLQHSKPYYSGFGTRFMSLRLLLSDPAGNIWLFYSYEYIQTVKNVASLHQNKPVLTEVK